MNTNIPISVGEAGGELGRELVANMGDLTWNRHGEMAMENARRNRAHLDRGQSLAALRNLPVAEGDSAIVIAAGPSIRRHDPIRRIMDKGFNGTLVATESAIPYCLRNGVVPHVVVTVDPDPKRIVRWFGDPHLTSESIADDDYFARQDLDKKLADQMRANEEICELLDKHGRGIKICLSTSTSESVLNRVLEIGMEVYWWNPMLDDPDMEGSVTAELQAMNGLPCINAGGNVGTASWMMAGMVLGKKHVALTGMDFSYYDGTLYHNTQYYREAVALVGEENLESLYIRVYNPYTKSWFFSDPAYYWYRQNLLEMAEAVDWKTYNCTGGGIIFGDAITFTSLDTFMERPA